MRQERRAAAPCELRIAISDRDQDHRHREPLRDAERPAPERRHVRTARGRALREVQHRRTRRQQIVDPAQRTGAARGPVALNEHHAETARDRADDRPARDIALGDRDRRTHRQDRDGVEIADVVGDQQHAAARDLPANADLQIVRAGDRAEHARQAVCRRVRPARWRHPHGAELGQRMEQPAADMPSGVLEAPHAATWGLGSRPSRSYFGRSFSNCGRSIFDTIRSSPGP